LDNLWTEWQDRRTQILNTLESLEYKLQLHVSNLDAAFEIITDAGIVHNDLKRKDQKELLRQMINKVVMDATGTIGLSNWLSP